MKSTVLISILLLGLASAAGAQIPKRLDNESLERAGGAAREALQTFGLLVNERNFEELGFSSRQEAGSASLGQPIEEFMIRLDNLRQYDPDQRGIVISPTRRLTYPVLAGGQQRSSLTVAQSEVGWAAVSFGAPNYSRLLVDSRERLGGSAKRPASDYFEVRVPALNVSFVARQDGEDIVLTPVADDARFDFEAGEDLSLDEALKAMAPVAREHNGLPT